LNDHFAEDVNKDISCNHQCQTASLLLARLAPMPADFHSYYVQSDAMMVNEWLGED
jgi:hypothetical protein